MGLCSEFGFPSRAERKDPSYESATQASHRRVLFDQRVFGYPPEELEPAGEHRQVRARLSVQEKAQKLLSSHEVCAATIPSSRTLRRDPGILVPPR